MQERRNSIAEHWSYVFLALTHRYHGKHMRSIHQTSSLYCATIGSFTYMRHIVNIEVILTLIAFGNFFHVLCIKLKVTQVDEASVHYFMVMPFWHWRDQCTPIYLTNVSGHTITTFK